MSEGAENNLLNFLFAPKFHMIAFFEAFSPDFSSKERNYHSKEEVFLYIYSES